MRRIASHFSQPGLASAPKVLKTPAARGALHCAPKRVKPLFLLFSHPKTFRDFQTGISCYSNILQTCDALEFLHHFEVLFFHGFKGAVDGMIGASDTQLKETLFMRDLVQPAIRRFQSILIGREKGCLAALNLLEKYEQRLLFSDSAVDGKAGNVFRQSVAFLSRGLLFSVFNVLDAAIGLGEGDVKKTIFYRFAQQGIKMLFVHDTQTADREETEMFHFKCALLPYVVAYFFFTSTRMRWTGEDVTTAKNPLRDLFPVGLENQVWFALRQFAQRFPVDFAVQMQFLEEQLLSRCVGLDAQPIPEAKGFFMETLFALLHPVVFVPQS